MSTTTGGDGVLLICGSRKPAPGEDKPSAARQFLVVVGEALREAGVTHESIDLHDLELPHFDGRAAPEYGCADLDRAEAGVRRSRLLVVSVPAYWGGPAGVVKNFLDLLGGAAYDHPPDQPLPLLGKTVALLVVGSDTDAAYAAHIFMRHALTSMGAWVAPRAEVVGNPRLIRKIDVLLASLRDFGGYVAELSRAEAAVRR